MESTRRSFITKDPKAPAQFQRTVDDCLADVSKKCLIGEESIRFGQDDVHAEADTGAEPGQDSLRHIQADISQGHDKELPAFGGLSIIWKVATIPSYGGVRA